MTLYNYLFHFIIYICICMIKILYLLLKNFNVYNKIQYARKIKSFLLEI
jgi:hypothetical protein